MDNLVQIFNANITTWYVLLILSFLGGIIASISPCSLAMLPLIIGYIGGFSSHSVLRTFLQLCTFIFGTAIIFSLIGIICALTGEIFISAFGQYFMLIIASLFLILGLKLLNIIEIELPVIVKAMPTNTTQSVFIYPLILGMTFAFAGTPCSTPILAGIMGFAALGKNILLAIVMLFLFALGQGIILIIAGLFTASIKHSTVLSKFSNIVTKISGILLILFSVYMYLKIFMPLF